MLFKKMNNCSKPQEEIMCKRVILVMKTKKPVRHK